MNPGRLIRLVPTGELSHGIEVVEPVEVLPLSDDQIEAIWEADTTSSDDCKSLYYAKLIARAIERAHGIGRRLDA